MRIAPNVTPGKYPCIFCGSEDANVIREGADPRLKCNVCNGLYDGSQSTEAKEAGQIPDPNNPPKPSEPRMLDEAASNPRTAPSSDREPVEEAESKLGQDEPQRQASIPRTPDFVFITRNRRDSEVEYVTKKDLKKTVLKWESRGVNYDIYSLTPKKAQVKVDFND